MGFKEWIDVRTGLTVWVSSGHGEIRVLPDVAADVLLWQNGLHLAGFDTRAHSFQRAVGETTIGVRLPPGMLASVAGDAASAMLDHRRHLCDANDALMLAGDNPAAAARELAAWTARQLDATSPSEEGSGAARAILCSALRGDRVSAVARALGWSNRKLQRFTIDNFGMPPVQLRATARFHRAAKLIEQGVALADVAALAGYADQAHLTRSMRQIAGTTPALLHAANRDSVSGTCD